MPTKNSDVLLFALAVTVPRAGVLNVAVRVPKSAKSYSTNVDQFGANRHSAPPPIVQPVRVWLLEATSRPAGLMIRSELSRQAGPPWKYSSHCGDAAQPMRPVSRS